MRRIFYLRRGAGASALQARDLWFFYRGRPVYLIGGGTASVYGDSVPGAPGTEVQAWWTSRLDRFREGGINLVRFSPWTFCWDDAPPPWACPYPVLSPPGAPIRYDVGRFHAGFFDTLRLLCREASRRDIVLLLVLFDDGALAPGGASGGPWMRNPFHTLCGGPCARPADFYDLESKDNASVQDAWAKQVFTVTRGFGNVFYEVCAEIGASVGDEVRAGAWLRHHLATARKEAPGHLLGVSGSSWSEDGGSAEPFWGVEGVDVLLPHERSGAAALRREATAHQFRYYSREGIDKPRILGEMVFGPGASSEEERKHLWIALTNGGHVFLAAPKGGLAETGTVLRACGALQEFLRNHGGHWWEMRPLDGLLSPDPGRAYAIGNPSRGEYLVYFLERPLVPVSLTLPDGAPEYALTWVDPRDGTVIEEQTLPRGGGALSLPPGTADVALVVVRAA